MSNKCLDAAWLLRLSPMRKLLLIALADQADANGVTCVSRSRLARMTNQGETTVKRELRALARSGLLTVAQAATSTTVQRYALQVLRGATLAPGATLTPGHTELRGGPHRTASDPFTVPSAKINASRRREVPTQAQLQKLAHVFLDDPHVQFEDDGDFIEAVKKACAQAGFEYDSAHVISAINQALVARGRRPLYQELKGARR